MKGGMNTAFRARSAAAWLFCVSTRNVRNIWNISIRENKTLNKQWIEGENLFQSNRNTLEQTGTNLFRHVPEMFRFWEFQKIGYSLSATRLSAIRPEQMFRHVPVWWNIDQSSESPERRGLQLSALWGVPDVPDVLTPYTESIFPLLSSLSPRCPPWPS